jgi:hypothetical protein
MSIARISMRLDLVDQAVVDSVEGKLEPVGHAEFVENVMQMILDRLLADEKFLADFAVAKALRHKLDDFFFAIAQQPLFAALSGLGGLLERIDHFSGHAVVEPDFAVMDLTNALQKQITGRLLEHHAPRAQAHGTDHVAVIFGGCEHDHARGQGIEVHFREDAEAVLLRHPQIEQQDIGLELVQHLYTLVAVRGFAHYGDIISTFEELSQSVSEYCMVVCDQDLDR